MRKEIIGNCELYLGDCMEVMPMLGKVDLLLTDPPYGIGASSAKFKNGTSKTSKEYYSKDWDNNPIQQENLDIIIKKAYYYIIWGGNYYKLNPSRCFFVWDKTIHGNSYADCELALTNINQNARIKQINMVEATLDGRVHPTQKPLKLMKWCIEQCKFVVNTILDPFMGSGTTGVACQQMGKKFIGIEKEPEYFDIACKRIEEASKQGDLFL